MASYVNISLYLFHKCSKIILMLLSLYIICIINTYSYNIMYGCTCRHLVWQLWENPETLGEGQTVKS